MSKSNQCATCKWFFGVESCKAFPDRIPQEILSGEFDHTKKHPKQDNDILYDSGPKNLRDLLFKPETTE